MSTLVLSILIKQHSSFRFITPRSPMNFGIGKQKSRLKDPGLYFVQPQMKQVHLLNRLLSNKKIDILDFSDKIFIQRRQSDLIDSRLKIHPKHIGSCHRFSSNKLASVQRALIISHAQDHSVVPIC